MAFEQLVCTSIDGFGLNVLRFNHGIYTESHDNWSLQWQQWSVCSTEAIILFSLYFRGDKKNNRIYNKLHVPVYFFQLTFLVYGFSGILISPFFAWQQNNERIYSPLVVFLFFGRICFRENLHKNGQELLLLPSR